MGGCVQKDDGLWCETSKGTWTNKKTGENVSKEQAATYEQTGCVQKDDGRWCKQSDGSWINKDTGKTATKAQVEKCVQKADGLWCPHGWGSWINTDSGEIWSGSHHFEAWVWIYG